MHSLPPCTPCVPPFHLSLIPGPHTDPYPANGYPFPTFLSPLTLCTSNICAPHCCALPLYLLLLYSLGLPLPLPPATPVSAAALAACAAVNAHAASSSHVQRLLQQRQGWLAAMPVVWRCVGWCDGGGDGREVGGCVVWVEGGGRLACQEEAPVKCSAVHRPTRVRQGARLMRARLAGACSSRLTRTSPLQVPAQQCRWWWWWRCCC